MTPEPDDASTFLPDVETVRYWCIAGTGSDANHYSAAFDRFLERVHQQAIAAYLAEHRNVTREAEHMRSKFARAWQQGYDARVDDVHAWDSGEPVGSTANPYGMP